MLRLDEGIALLEVEGMGDKGEDAVASAGNSSAGGGEAGAEARRLGAFLRGGMVEGGVREVRARLHLERVGEGY